MPSMGDELAISRLREARVGRLATVRPDGSPHVVPFAFALLGRTVYWIVDAKPKRSSALRRLENIEREPRVELVVDAYDEDWSTLWWVRARGTARIVEDEDERVRALASLREKYAPYADAAPEVVVAIDLERISGWSAS
jgi:PPOX class probable F420-dependent enzyme